MTDAVSIGARQKATGLLSSRHDSAPVGRVDPDQLPKIRMCPGGLHHDRSGSSRVPSLLVEDATEALAYPNRFLAQAMTYGTIEDLAVVKRYLPESAFREVLADPPAGVFDPRSWAYWHVRFGLEPPTELPKRFLP
jgi:hypothetical protein